MKELNKKSLMEIDGGRSTWERLWEGVGRGAKKYINAADRSAKKQFDRGTFSGRRL